MESLVASLEFGCAGIAGELASRTDDLDDLPFGVIGFDPAGIVRRYNRFESEAAGLAPARVLGRPLFTEVAPCMNNFMVAHRFADAALRDIPLDDIVDYVLTLRMRPTRVRLRLVAEVGAELAYVLVDRRPAGAPQGARVIAA